jgi:hypothetical protein
VLESFKNAHLEEEKQQNKILKKEINYWLPKNENRFFLDEIYIL